LKKYLKKHFLYLKRKYEIKIIEDAIFNMNFNEGNKVIK